jgi:hypothetical protein
VDRDVQQQSAFARRAPLQRGEALGVAEHVCEQFRADERRP